jgi:hypothetical protein
MAFVEDLSIFFDTNGFGEEFTYNPKVGSSLTVVGIYDAGYYAAPGGEVAVASSQPQIQYATASIPDAPIYGETVTFKGQDFTIVGIEPDGTGVTTLILEKSDDAC